MPGVKKPAQTARSGDDRRKQKQLFASLSNAFTDAKDHSRNNKRHIDLLLKLTKDVSTRIFFEFLQCVLMRVFVLSKDSGEATKLVRFAVDFLVACQKQHVAEHEGVTEDGVAEPDDDHIGVHPLIEKFVFPWLLVPGVSDSKEPSVRFHAIRMMALLLVHLPETTRIELTLFNKAQSAFLRRAKDKVAQIRIQAMKAMSRLQDCRDPNCLVTDCYLHHAERDPNWQVRRAALISLQPSRRALRAILDRTKDVNANVRKEAYGIIGRRVSVKAIKKPERVDIVKRGLTDRNEHVRRCVETDIVTKWIEVSGGILPLLEKLDLPKSAEAGSQVLGVYFRFSNAYDIVGNLQGIIDPDTKMIPYERLNLENALYWASALQCLKSRAQAELTEKNGTEEKPLKPFKEQVPKTADDLDDDDEDAAKKEEEERASSFYLAMIEPVAVEFANYLRKYVASEATPVDDLNMSSSAANALKLATLKQLIKLCSSFSYSDGAARKEIGRSMKEIICDREMSRTLIPTIVEVFPVIYPEPKDRVEAVLDIVSELRQPLVEMVAPIRRGPGPCEALTLNQQFEHKRLLMDLQIARAALEEASQRLEYDRLAELSASVSEKGRKLKDFEEELAKAKRAEEEAVAAAAAEAEIEEEPRSDQDTELRALAVVREVLNDLRIHPFPAQLHTLKSDFVLKCVSKADVLVRKEGVYVLSQCCALSMSIATEHFGLLMQVFDLDSDDIKVTALQGIFDVLLRWGPRVFGSETDKALEVFRESMMDKTGIDVSHASGRSQNPDSSFSEHPKSKILKVLLKSLGDDDKHIRATTAMGLSKLMLVPWWKNGKVLSRLIILFYNPAQHDLDGLIRQVLTAFLTLVSLDPENRAFVEEAYFRAMRTYQLAPTYSPLKSITWEDVMRTIVDMLKNLDLRASNVEDKPAQESFMYRLLAELTRPESTDDDDVPVLHAKALNLVELPLQRFQTIGAYISAAKKILDIHQNGNPIVVKNMRKFLTRCEEIWARKPSDMYPDVSSNESAATLTDNGDESMVPCVSRDLGDGEDDEDDSQAVPVVQGIKAVVRRRTLLSRSQEMDEEDTLGMVKANEGLDADDLRTLIAMSNRRSQTALESDRASPAPSHLSRVSTDSDMVNDGDDEDRDEHEFMPPVTSTGLKAARNETSHDESSEFETPSVTRGKRGRKRMSDSDESTLTESDAPKKTATKNPVGQQPGRVSVVPESDGSDDESTFTETQPKAPVSSIPRQVTKENLAPAKAGNGRVIRRNSKSATCSDDTDSDVVQASPDMSASRRARGNMSATPASVQGSRRKAKI